MDLNPKMLRDALDQFLEREVRLFRACCLYKIQNRFGEFVGTLRTAFVRQQAVETVFPQSPVGFVVGDPGKPKSVGGTGHGPAVAVNTA